MLTILPDASVMLIQAEIEREEYASNFYKAAAIWAEAQGFFGSAKYLRAASAEELTHRDGFVQYLVDLDAPVYMPAVSAPPRAWPDLRSLFEDAITLEVLVTTKISEIATRAEDMNDWQTFAFVQPYMVEQTKGLSELYNIRRLFAQFGADVAGLKLIDADIEEMAA